MTELNKYIGPNINDLTGDIGVGNCKISILYEQ